MYIVVLHTINNRIAIEVADLGKAINTLNDLMDSHKNEILTADILRENKYLDDQYPDFKSCDPIVSMRTIR